MSLSRQEKLWIAAVSLRITFKFLVNTQKTLAIAIILFSRPRSITSRDASKGRARR